VGNGISCGAERITGKERTAMYQLDIEDMEVFVRIPEDIITKKPYF